MICTENRRLAFTVQQITPVASQEEGRNFFRVEAHLQTPSVRVRPGMEGVGKIEVGSFSRLVRTA